VQSFSVQRSRLFAHPYYPQDKGKVERMIRNLNQEFVHLLRKFPGWLDGKIHEYRDWFNNDRFHRRINGFPARLYRVSSWKVYLTWI